MNRVVCAAPDAVNFLSSLTEGECDWKESSGAVAYICN